MAKPKRTPGRLANPRLQRKLEASANRILRRSGYFSKVEKTEALLPAEAVGIKGLRPVWHGRA